MSYEDTLDFLETIQSQAESRAFTIAQEIMLQQQSSNEPELEEVDASTNVQNTAQGTPPSIGDALGWAEVIKPDREGPPSLSEMLSQLGGDSLDDIPNPDPAWLDDQAQKWMQEYFPNLTSGLADIPEQWVADIMARTSELDTNTQVLRGIWDDANADAENAGIAAGSFDSVWSGARAWVQAVTGSDSVYERAFQLARDRAEVTLSTEQRNIDAGFAARGFSMPPGAMVTANMEAQQRATNAPLEVSVEQAIRQTEIQLTLDRTAVGITSDQVTQDASLKNQARTTSAQIGAQWLTANKQILANLVELGVRTASQLRVDVVRSMAEFYRSWVTLYTQDRQLDRAQVKAQIISTFEQAIGRYYDVDVTFEQLKQTRAQLGLQSIGQYQDAAGSFEQLKAQVAQYDAQAKAGNQQRKLNLFGLRDRGQDALANASRGFADVSASAVNAASSLTAQIESI